MRWLSANHRGRIVGRGMSVRVRDLVSGGLEQLRHEPIEKRIRARAGEETVIDTRRALLVWEPKRVVPSYAVPEADVSGELAPAAAQDDAPVEGQWLGERRVYDPRIPFSVHTSEGEPVSIRAGGGEAAGFRPADPDLAGYVIVDFGGFDGWLEEDEPNVGHPRDPFHRIDIVHSSRHVWVEHDGEVVAESTRPYLLFETQLPVRYYLPREDVRPDRLASSDTHTFCAYKGRASYLSLTGAEDVAWFYPEPLREAAEVTDRVAFFNERVDIVVDGERLERPRSPWS
jgi:uncharacterized protein (DUF427 family)